MQLRLPLRPNPHLGNCLAAVHGVALFHAKPIVVTVSAEIGVIVLNDQQLPIAYQPAARVDDAARGGRMDCLAYRTADADPVAQPGIGAVRAQQLPFGGPLPGGWRQFGGGGSGRDGAEPELA